MNGRPKTVEDVRKMEGRDIAEWLIQMADVYDRMKAAEQNIKDIDEYADRCGILRTMPTVIKIKAIIGRVSDEQA